MTPALRTALEALRAWVELSRPTLLNGRIMCDTHAAAEQAIAVLAGENNASAIQPTPPETP